LRKEHKEIKYSLDSIKAMISQKPGEDNLLLELHDLRIIIIAHLELENKLLYPALNKSEYKELRMLGKSFSEEMAKIAKGVFAFFDRYGKKDISILTKSIKFKDDFLEIYQAIIKRVSIEEGILFPAYERYIKE